MIDTNLQQYSDKLGIVMLYPTKHNGEEWYMNMTEPNHDSRFDIAHEVNDLIKNHG
jgi:hypothetical protein